MSNVAFCSKPTYKLQLNYDANSASMRLATNLLDTGAASRLVNRTLFPSQWTSRIKHVKMPHLRTATQEPLYMEGTILLHVSLNDLRVRLWSGIVLILAVDMLLGTSFIYRFAHRIFLANRRVALWHSHLIAILAATQCNQATRTSASHLPAPIGKPSIDYEASSHPVCIPRQTVLKPHSEQHVLLTTTAFAIDTRKPKNF